MGFLDDARDKATEAIGDHPDQVSEGIDKAGDFADDKTGGKFGDQIDQGADMAKERLGVDGAGEGGGQGGGDPEARGEGGQGGGEHRGGGN